jgi:hypothetical protein
MEVVGRKEADVLVNFKPDLAVSPYVVELFAKWMRMHVNSPIRVNKIHRDYLRKAAGVDRADPADWLSVQEFNDLCL